MPVAAPAKRRVRSATIRPMLFLLSPAKSLNYETPLNGQAHSAPLFVKESKALIDLLRKQSPQQIADLMNLSDKLSTLNVARYRAWSSRATEKNARQAVLAFDGDVYGGLDAHSLSADDLAFAQEHVCILSGLYGVLRPLDWMQPYRLEMGTALANSGGKDLYAFWGSQIANYLNTRLRKDASPVVVNLASQEYFKAVDTKVLKSPVVECVFQDYKAGEYKVISFFAKRARGLMARHAMLNRVTQLEQLKTFAAEGYAFAEKVSTPGKLVFRRRV